MTAVKAHGGAKFRTTPDSESVELRRELRLDAFDPEYRRFIRELTSCSTALEDLADSFPGLLFALASNYATPAQREQAFEMVYEGVPLRSHNRDWGDKAVLAQHAERVRQALGAL